MNFPLPMDFHCTPLAILTVAHTGIEEVSLQTTTSLPAFTAGAFVKVMITVSVSAGHKALFVEISSNVSFPFFIAAAVAVYVGLRTFAFGANEPLPFQFTPPALIMVAFNTTEGLLAQ